DIRESLALPPFSHNLHAHLTRHEVGVGGVLDQLDDDRRGALGGRVADAADEQFPVADLRHAEVEKAPANSGQPDVQAFTRRGSSRQTELTTLHLPRASASTRPKRSKRASRLSAAAL